MSCLTCNWDAWRALSKAAAKAASARVRKIGLSRFDPQWTQKATICERCPLRVIHRGASYCGKPFLDQIHRDEAVDGCGCPTHDKAKDPGEHCPIDTRHQPSQRFGSDCNCKWCSLVKSEVSRAVVTR